MSPLFYSWVFGFAGRMTIESPEKAKSEFKRQLQAVEKSFSDNE